jgi:wingless-type MMTV integration site family protein 4
MSSIAAIEVPGMCESLIGLAKRQQKICRRNIEVMDSVRYGAHMAIEECQFQFRNRRWNCSTVDPVKLFGNFLKLGKVHFEMYKFPLHIIMYRNLSYAILMPENHVL